MASDNLLNVIRDLVKRDGRLSKAKTEQDNEKIKKAREKEAEKDDEEEDEDEDPVGDGKSDAKAAEKEPEPEPEPEPEDEPEPEPEDEPEDKPEPKGDNGDDKKDGDFDNKPTGPDPALVAQVAAIVKKEIEDDEKEKKDSEIKLSGKKEKVDTKPSIKEGKMPRLSFRDAIRASVTGTSVAEGYESHVLAILDDEGIDGPLGYNPFFERGKLYVMKGKERAAKKALQNSGEINKIPRIVGEELETEEYLAMEAVDVDGRCKGFKEALRRLTYEKIKKMKEKLTKEGADDGKSGDKEAYQAFFQGALKKFGVTEPDQLKGEKKKEFFDYVDANWKGDNEKPEPGDKKEGADDGKSGDKEAYQAFFQGALKKFGVTEPDQLKGDKKKEFFDYVDANWKGDNEKPEPGDKKEQVELNTNKHMGVSNKELEEHCGHCEFGLEEKAKYDLYHKTFSAAMQHAYDVAKKQGFIVDPDDIDSKVATGPRKPSSGKTNRYILGTDKKKKLHVQVANLDNKKYELNMYIEGFEPVDEHKGTEPHEHPHDDEELDEKKMKLDAKIKQRQRRKKASKGSKMKDPDRKYAIGVAKRLRAGKKAAKDPARGRKQAARAKMGSSYEPQGTPIDEAADRRALKKFGDELEKYASKGGIDAHDFFKVASIAKKGKMPSKKEIPSDTDPRDYVLMLMMQHLKKKDLMIYKGLSPSFDSWLKESAQISKVRGVRNRLIEALDRHAVTELKLYIENDSDLYRQTVSIVKNIQRKMKSGKYDHTRAPKLWMYLVDAGAKKYVKEFGGDVRSQFPKDVRHSVAVDFANEYRAEIESQGGQMF